MPLSFHHSSGRRDSLEELALRVNIAAHFPTAPRFHLWNPVVSAPAVRAIFPMPRRKTLGRRDTRGVFPPSSRHKPRKGERDIRPTIGPSPDRRKPRSEEHTSEPQSPC